MNCPVKKNGHCRVQVGENEFYSRWSYKFGEFVFKPIESKASSVLLGGIFQDCLVMCNQLLVVASLVVPTKYQYLTCNTRLILVG